MFQFLEKCVSSCSDGQGNAHKLKVLHHCVSQETFGASEQFYEMHLLQGRLLWLLNWNSIIRKPPKAALPLGGRHRGKAPWGNTLCLSPSSAFDAVRNPLLKRHFANSMLTKWGCLSKHIKAKNNMLSTASTRMHEIKTWTQSVLEFVPFHNQYSFLCIFTVFSITLFHSNFFYLFI